MVMPPSGTSDTVASFTFAMAERLWAAHRARVEPVEVVDAALAADREAAGFVGPRPEAFLHRLADRDVLALDLVGELDRLPDRLGDPGPLRIPEEPLERGQRPIEPERHDQVRRVV